ncbi:MAG: universal stress protein [Deferrisomatales bacterium]|nr:universal stress protein [Deferrisomatales bacterium]
MEVPTPRPAGCPRSFRRILVATHFSPRSKRAFHKALDLAADLGAEIHLLHVHSVPAPRPLFFISMHPEDHRRLSERAKGRARRRFEDFLRGEDLGTVPVTTVVRQGLPPREIVAYAAEAGSDLVVVGERPETRAQHVLQHLVFESVGERVRRESPCPVLTVR